MFKIKIQSKFTKLLLVSLLILLVLSRTSALVHSFSHQEVASSSVELVQNEPNFLEKIIFSHSKSSDKKSENCFLCSVSNFQNQITLPANLVFYAAFFFLAFAFRQFNRVKLSYLLASKAPRAPPSS